MLKLFYTLPNGKSFAHISRSCTTTIATHALKQFYPEKYEEFVKERWTCPQAFLDESWSTRLPPECVCMVRKPEDRLLSLLAKNGDSSDMVTGILEILSTGASKRVISRKMRILKIVHVAPVSVISEDDSKLILWPNVEEACAELGLQYDPQINENQLNPEALKRYENTLLPENWKIMLEESTALWKKLQSK